MDEDALLTLFEKLNVRVGKLNPLIIKAWFDTDSDNLLQWMYTSITEECYVSAQQEFEYSQCDVLLPHQLQKKINIVEIDYPDIFQVDANLSEIEFYKSTIDMLEVELKGCDHQIHVNQQLCQNLLDESSQITKKEIQSQVEEESAQENCVTLCREFDEINSQTYDQILKYGSHLSNYEFAEIPAFVNEVDILEFWHKFSNADNSLHSLIQIQQDTFETSCVKYLTETLPELGNWIFQSKVSLITLQMEIEALNSTLNFLDNFNVKGLWIDHESLALSIAVNRERLAWMLNIIEGTSHQLAQHYIKQPTLQRLKNEFEFFHLKLNYLNKFSESFSKILRHFIVMHALFLQEKMDINSSSLFFKNINKYVNNDVKYTTFRIEAMLKLISEYEDFCSTPFENKFKLIGNIGTILLKRDNTSLDEVEKEVAFLRNNLKKLKKQQWRGVRFDEKVFKELLRNIRILKTFLICGPTSQIVTVPIPLQILLFDVNKNLVNQRSSVKLLIQAAQKPKDQRAKDKWIKYRNLLWTYFMTDSVKLRSLLEQFKADDKPFKEKDI